MKANETHTVTLSLDKDEEFDAPLASYTSYRGRSAKDGAMVRVHRIEVDVIARTITAEGAAILVNGGTSGYGHRADLSEDQAKLVRGWYRDFVLNKDVTSP
jgi:homoserine acetyltransferase